MRRAAAAVLAASALCATAWWWSASTETALERRAAGWMTVTLGGGAVPDEAPHHVEAPGPRPLFEPREEVQPAPAPALPPERGPIRWVVREGDTLGELCRRFYNTARPEILEAVAAFNGLDDADDIREGQPLEFPPRSALVRSDGPR